MPRFLTQAGTATNDGDPDRLMWYAASPECGYWTDDWDRLRVGKGRIPCCPHCGCVGLQMTARQWADSLDRYEAGNAGYKAGVMAQKNRCKKSPNTISSFLKPVA